MRTFVSDYGAGLAQGRYVVGGLPDLALEDGQFDLALCSHLLFLYSNVLSFEFHLQSILELCRVAKEVRVFPLIGLDCELSPYVRPVQAQLRRHGLQVEVVTVNYQLVRKANEMMRIWK
jgi:hypothetical protein